MPDNFISAVYIETNLGRTTFNSKKLLSAYTENTLNGEKSIKRDHLSVNNGTTWNFF
jgi:hypothetical protein